MPTIISRRRSNPYRYEFVLHHRNKKKKCAKTNTSFLLSKCLCKTVTHVPHFVNSLNRSIATPEPPQTRTDMLSGSRSARQIKFLFLWADVLLSARFFLRVGCCERAVTSARVRARIYLCVFDSEIGSVLRVCELKSRFRFRFGICVELSREFFWSIVL